MQTDHYCPIFYHFITPNPPVTNRRSAIFVAYTAARSLPSVALDLEESVAVAFNLANCVNNASTIPEVQLDVPVAGRMIYSSAIGYADLCVLGATLRYP